jgi:hypothetical protein
MRRYRLYYTLGYDKTDWDFNPRILRRADLPYKLCPACRTKDFGDPFATIPEPVPKLVHQRLRRYRPTECVSPDEFAELEHLVRSAYNFPPERLILSGTVLGEMYLMRKEYVSAWHIYKSPEWGRVVLSGVARRQLEQLRVSNLLWFPVLNRDRRPLDLYQLVVLGNFVLPEIDVGEWQQCSVCGHWRVILSGRQAATLNVPDEFSEDFVYLETIGVVISERVVDLLYSLGADTVWVEFEPLSQRRVLSPELLREEEERSRVALEELQRSIRPPEF